MLKKLFEKIISAADMIAFLIITLLGINCLVWLFFLFIPWSILSGIIGRKLFTK